MPGKAKGDGSLSGGTGDVNPQIYRLVTPTTTTLTTSSVTSASFSTSFPVPINRLQQQSGKATVMELLKVRWNTVAAYNVNVSGPQIINTTGWLSTTPGTAQGIGAVPSFPAGSPKVLDQINGSTFYDYDTTSDVIYTARFDLLQL